MSADGTYAIAGCDDERVRVFKNEALIAEGPINGNCCQKRATMLSKDNKYFAVGGDKFTLHDLSATNVLQPIYTGIATGQLRAIDFSDDHNYVAFGGRMSSPTSDSYFGVYDLNQQQLIFSDTISQPPTENGEIRELAISPNGDRIVFGLFSGSNSSIYYYVRVSGTDQWTLIKSILVGSSIYWVDMDASGDVVVISTQSHNTSMYDLTDTSMTTRWTFPGTTPLANPVDGGVRYLNLTENGKRVALCTRGGGNGAGQIFVLDSAGRVEFSYRSSYGSHSSDPDSWFGAISEDLSKITFASQGGYAYFFGFNTTGSNDLNRDFSSLLHVAPNPTTGLVQLTFNTMQNQVQELELTDSQGKLIQRTSIPMNASQVELDMSKVKAGLYYITLRGNAVMVTKRVIVEN